MRLEQLSTEIKLLDVSIHCMYMPAYTLLSYLHLQVSFQNFVEQKINCPIKLSLEIHVGFYSISHDLVDYH